MRRLPINIRVSSFGPLSSLFSPAGTWRELPAGSSVATLVDAIRGDSAIVEAMLCKAAVAVNLEYSHRDRKLSDGDEVAILPPVSGGASPPESTFVALVREPIVKAELVERVRGEADGAIVTFDGLVRDNTQGRPAVHLDYEAYEDMALKQMQGLRAEAIARFGVREIAIVHRLGWVAVGQTSVLIIVASANRAAAFEAARFVIDSFKKIVSVWKKEQFVDGALWADSEPFPQCFAVEESLSNGQEEAVASS